MAHRAKLRAKGMEQKGKGAANATRRVWLVPDGDRTTVKMVADIQLTGAVAQLSRGLLPEVSSDSRRSSPSASATRSSRATRARDRPDGAERRRRADAPPSRPPAPCRPPRAIGGIRLGLAAIWARDRERVPQLFGGRRVISAVVLAAGSATRFGRTKQLELVRGKPLAQHAIDAAVGRRAFDEIVVVLGHDAERVRAALRLPSTGRTDRQPRVRHRGWLRHSPRACGRSTPRARPRSSCWRISRASRRDACPRARRRASAIGARPIVRLRFRIGPGPALLARAIWPEAERLEGDAGARILMERHPGLGAGPRGRGRGSGRRRRADRSRTRLRAGTTKRPGTRPGRFRSTARSGGASRRR